MGYHEKVFGYCDSGCRVAVYSQEKTKELLEKQIIVMEKDSYIDPDKRQKGVLYFNTTEKVSGGSGGDIDSVKVSPNMGIKIVD